MASPGIADCGFGITDYGVGIVEQETHEEHCKGFGTERQHIQAYYNDLQRGEH